MGKTTEQIVSDIDQTREELMSNLEELESRVKAVANWRAQVEKHPGAMVMAAVIGGMVLSSLLGHHRED